MEHEADPAGNTRWASVANGDEGDRTPDLVNAIHALSQLSYVPKSVRGNHIQAFPPEPRNLSQGIVEVKEMGLAE